MLYVSPATQGRLSQGPASHSFGMSPIGKDKTGPLCDRMEPDFSHRKWALTAGLISFTDQLFVVFFLSLHSLPFLLDKRAEHSCHRLVCLLPVHFLDISQRPLVQLVIACLLSCTCWVSPQPATVPGECAPRDRRVVHCCRSLVSEVAPIASSSPECSETVAHTSSPRQLRKEWNKTESLLACC